MAIDFRPLVFFSIWAVLIGIRAGQIFLKGALDLLPRFIQAARASDKAMWKWPCKLIDVSIDLIPVYYWKFDKT